jgi:hypothetical protein
MINMFRLLLFIYYITLCTSYVAYFNVDHLSIFCIYDTPSAVENTEKMKACVSGVQVMDKKSVALPKKIPENQRVQPREGAWQHASKGRKDQSSIYFNEEQA